VRLAPLYDIASVLPYDDIDLHKAKVSMKIGGEYQLLNIAARNWQRLAQEVRVDAARLFSTLRATAQRLPDELQRVRAQVHEEGLDLAIVDRLAERLTKRSQECLKLLGS
jgi:serine/threonine-protein kinase HipA